MKKVLFNHAIKSIFFLNILLVILIVGFIFIKGYKIISLKFLFTMPYNSMTEGGIFPALVGTFLLTSLSIILALPPGVITAIYLNEYVKNKHLINIIKISINTLAGVPSVVFGLFGFSVFVKFFGFGVSLLSGAFTLSIVILPIFISATIEALSAVPYSLREASMALGATKLYTIRHTVLPAAFSSIMTAIILSTGRAAGETAPILFTAAVFFSKKSAGLFVFPGDGSPLSHIRSYDRRDSSGKTGRNSLRKRSGSDNYRFVFNILGGFFERKKEKVC